MFKGTTALLVRDGCRSISPVEITSCEGSCVTSSMYSAKASAMMHSCSCCQEMSTSMREVKMKCPNGITVTHSYVYIETCGCYAAVLTTPPPAYSTVISGDN
uniref:CTCK domain-containing protein n=1 Tax=Scleropages formosus TaxID=113540 RepID=A0A8C9V9P0_SCLFO